MATEPPAADARTNWILILTLVALVLAVLLIAAGAVLAFVAYDRQSDRLEDLQEDSQRLSAEADRLEHDHTVIGQRFVQQSKELEQAAAAARNAYRRGVTVGRGLARLPRPVRRVARYAADGYLVPRRLPPSLQGVTPRVAQRAHGYTLRWPSVAVFASRRDPLEIWTRQAWPGTTSSIQVGRKRVVRVVGPLGIVYAWRHQRRTYAVVNRPERERTARLLVAAMG